MIQRLDQGQDLPKISIFLALQLLVASWNNVGKATIVNCFRKVKISTENQVDALEDSKEVLYLRWNERHLRAYFETLMTLLQT